MGKALSLYSLLPLKELEQKLKSHQEDFEILLGDTFSEKEMEEFSDLLDSMAMIIATPILGELKFSDFSPSIDQYEKQRVFFENCQSTLCLDHLPYLDTHPIQVSYLIDLLWSFDEVLIDRGGMSELCLKKEYLEELKKFKTMSSLIKSEPYFKTTPELKTQISPIDFLIKDIYKEIDRLNSLGRLPSNLKASEKVQKIYEVMSKGRWDSDALFKKCALSPKDFDDNLEKLKFNLRSLSLLQDP